MRCRNVQYCFLVCRAPLFPPRTLKFEIGFSKTHLQPVPGEYQVQPIHAVQTFHLPAELPVGHYLRIIMCDKLQQQFEDRQYFTAIRRVKAVGRCISSATMFKAYHMMQTRQLLLCLVSNMPATTYPLILDMAACDRYESDPCLWLEACCLMFICAVKFHCPAHACLPLVE